MLRTVMWEAKAADGAHEGLLAFALDHAHPDAAVYRSADQRIVVVDPSGTGLPDAPPQLLARPAHTWRFERVPRP